MKNSGTDDSGNYSVVNGDFDINGLPDDTMILVRAKDLRNRLEWLMFRIAQYGFSVHVKYDAWRKEKNFTVLVGNYPRADVEDPVRYLAEILQSKESENDGRNCVL